MADESARSGPVSVQWDTREYVQVADSFAAILNFLPLDAPLDKAQRKRISTYLRASVEAVQQHWHTFTCKKNGCEGTDVSCRLEYIRMLVNITHMLENDCTFALRRTRGNIVPYIRALMLACPGNHTMSIFAEASRWLRQTYLWHQEHPDGGVEVRGGCCCWDELPCLPVPVMLQIIKACKTPH